VIAGIAGIVGFFLPFMSVTEKTYNIQAELTAYELVRGAPGYLDLAERQAKNLDAKHKPEVERILHRIDDRVDAVRGVMIGLYVPAALLALIGLAGCIRGKYGRFAGLFSLALGLASTGIWLTFMFLSRQETSTSQSFSAALGTGLHLLLAAGAGGIVGGFGALVSPDRG
jgi:hypothetical protein